MQNTRQQVYVCICLYCRTDPREVLFSFSTFSLLIHCVGVDEYGVTAEEENPCFVVLGLPVALLSCFLGEFSS